MMESAECRLGGWPNFRQTPLLKTAERAEAQFCIFRGEDACCDPSHVTKETNDELDG